MRAVGDEMKKKVDAISHFEATNVEYSATLWSINRRGREIKGLSREGFFFRECGSLDNK